MSHRSIAESTIGSLISCSSPAVSPDGVYVAYVVGRVDLAANAYRSQIWLARTDGRDAPRPVSAGERASSPTWSADGTRLAFVAGRAEQRSDSTLHILPVGVPGEVLTVATMPDGLDNVRFSPDGRWLAFISRTRDARYDAKDESWQAPRKIERFLSQLNGEGWVVDRPRHVYVVPTDGTAGPRNLTPGPFQHDALAWQPDGSALIVAASRHDTWDTDYGCQLHRLTLTGRITALTSSALALALPSPSPDGRSIAAIGTDRPQVSPTNGHLAVMTRTGKDLRWVTTALDRTFAPYPSVRQPLWDSPTSLLATVEDRGRVHLYRCHTDASPPEALTSGPLTVTGFDHAGGVTVVTVSRVDETGDVYVLEHGSLRRLTDYSTRVAEAMSAHPPQPWEHFTVACPGGAVSGRPADGEDEIDAWIMRPARFDPKRRYPVLLNVHGGPFTQYGERFFDEAQMQAAAGFVVLMCNPRGGSGRSEAWGQCINGPQHPVAPGAGWGSHDADDVNAVVDAALRRYKFCDPRRVGMLGGSYGGFMATWLATTTGARYRAICSERAVNNMLTEEWTSDIATVFRTQIGASHVADPSEYVRMSPVHRVADIQIPMLLIHSERDLRCPISQAEELWVAMRLLGKDVTFYRFPGENHELSRSGSPVHRVQRAEIILDWFAERLAAPKR